MRPKRTGHSVKWSLKSAIAALILASASLVDAQTLQTLCSFNNTNGAYPYAGLTLGNDGNFYGTTEEGGSSGFFGTVFRVTTDGTLTTLVSFNPLNGNSGDPTAALTLGNDGNFYGTTSGRSGDRGTVFKVTTNGTLTTLVSFGGTNGAYMDAGLTLGNDGNFYGTTEEGGSGDWGTVFKVTTNGTLTTLVSFAGTNGASPWAALALGNDGNFYGTTASGGSSFGVGWGSGYGTVFKVTTNGTLTTLVSFSGTSTNGAGPEGALALGNDGNFYGTTSSGGNTSLNQGAGWGTVFKVTTNGTLTTLVAFNSAIGASPSAGLTLGNDGNFYGTTQQGGSSGFGTVFKVTTNGTLTKLVSFSGANGKTPAGALTVGSDGNLYGTTATGGSGYGTVFRLLLPINPPSITAQPLCCQVLLGRSVSFTVSVSGTAPFHYQWRFNGGSILDATNAAYAIQAVGATNTGNYSVVVTNSAGSVTSSNGVLTVIVLPTLGLQLSAGCPLLGLNGMLSNNFVVQYSSNLAGTNWINLLSLTNLPANPYLFLDSGGVGKPARFYRAFMQ
jgi:uncharacterized repeat protein (TIGR03803 family)